MQHVCLALQPLQDRNSDDRRRLVWLQKEVAETHGDEGATPQRQGNEDRFKCDPDRFAGRTGRLHKGWNEAVNIASWVHIDEMRALLEFHYGGLAT